MRLVLVRACLIAGAPLTISWGFLSTLLREIGRAFKYAWLDARMEASAARRYIADPDGEYRNDQETHCK